MTDAPGEVFTALQEWYHSNCDGDWEHSYELVIKSLDNPGWKVVIPLSETSLEGQAFDPVQWKNGPDDWAMCRVQDQNFRASCGSRNLTAVIRLFIEWTQAASNAT